MLIELHISKDESKTTKYNGPDNALLPITGKCDTWRQCSAIVKNFSGLAFYVILKLIACKVYKDPLQEHQQAPGTLLQYTYQLGIP